MAALNSSRQTAELAEGRRMVIPVEASTTIYLGAMVAINAAGNAVPASASAALTVVGMAERVQNGFAGQDAANVAPLTSGAAGAISVVVRRGIFHFDNDGSITAAKLDGLCYAKDDHTVTVTAAAGTQPVAGRLRGIDAAGVWVDFRHQSASAVAI